jgi:anti-sigma factor (TIGR02949 family)
LSADCSDGTAPDCAEVLRQLQVFLDRECAPSLEEVIHAHLGDCNPCLHRADFERGLRALIASRCRAAAPSGLVDRVLGTIRGGTLGRS